MPFVDMGTNQHVVPAGTRWAVRGEGKSYITSVHDTQEKAIQAAREIAGREQSEVLVHDREGQIRARDSYGADAFPPRG